MKLSDEILSKILIHGKALNKEGISKYLAIAQKRGVDFYNFLVSEKIIGREKLARLVAKSLNVNYVDLDKVEVDPNILQTLPEIVARENHAVVFARDKNGIHLALNDPTNEQFLRNFTKRTSENVIVYFADTEVINKIFKKYKADGEDLALLIEEILVKGKEATKAEDLPIIKVVDKLLEFAYNNKASDMHIEPYENRTLVRFRIDGILHDIINIPKNLHDLVITRIKILSRLRTDEHRAAQDGKLKFKTNGEKIDARVSIIPVIYGEKAVLRILAERMSEYDLERLGFRPAEFEKIKNNIEKPWGMILSTGPTGCGKTTTLYAILKKLNKREVNISTIEDPIEYDIEGINQIQVSPKTNLTFATGLRSIVRQDPDIIMVGEIRDEETAKIAINAALTGHLVLSTLHTNDAATTLPRLLDMGIQPFLVASTINLVIAQRLVRKICEKCKYKMKINSKIMNLIKKQLSAEIIKKYKLDDKNLILYYGKGCEDCQMTGYSGRIGIFELLDMNEQIKEFVMSKANAARIKQKACEMGMMTMIEDGILKALAGMTTIDDILRVAKE